jgi:hypothetical protein
VVVRELLAFDPRYSFGKESLMNDRTLTEQEIENIREKKFWENHVIGIFNLILALTVLIPSVVMACVWLYMRYAL